jgi:GNAT superfamily N-acetyltransferase
MNPIFEIKKATINDIHHIIELIKEIAEYEKLSNQVETTPEKIKQYLFSPNPFAHCYLGFENQELVGFSLYFFNFSTFVSKPGIYLEDLFVKEKYRGKGYGKKLLLNLINIANQNNFGRLEWSVLNWNQPAIEFYKSLGAEPMEGWTTFRLTEPNIKKL